MNKHKTFISFHSDDEWAKTELRSLMNEEDEPIYSHVVIDKLRKSNEYYRYVDTTFLTESIMMLTNMHGYDIYNF